ncbi:MAG: Hsp20/alpha crystallin family protein [Desulfomonilaceae bacterium]
MADQEIQARQKQQVTAPEGEFTREGTYFVPAVDIYDTNKELVLLADMPGVRTGDVEIDLKDDILTILGKVHDEGSQGQPILSEYRVGNYFRTFRLTEVVDQSKITAAMADGVLKLLMPKVEKAVPRKIPITVG